MSAKFPRGGANPFSAIRLIAKCKYNSNRIAKGFENKPVLFEQAKKALINFKDCFSIPSATNNKGESFSHFKRDKA